MKKKNGQTIVAAMLGALLFFCLPILAVANTDMGRVTTNPQSSMKKALLYVYDVDTETATIPAKVIFYDTTTNIPDAGGILFVTVATADTHTPAAIIASYKAQILAEASARSFTGFADTDILWVNQNTFTWLSVAPQAAIANAPADAVTNYNIVTTLLGTLTSAVNAANTKQNDIATKLNTLLAELRTLNIIST